MKLTDTKIRNAKPQEKAYQLQDGNGLYVKYCAKVDQGIGELWCKSAPP